MRKVLSLAFLVSFSSISCAAPAGTVQRQSRDSCEGAKEEPVCGVIAHKGLVMYRSDCEARAVADVIRIIKGPCDDGED